MRELINGVLRGGWKQTQMGDRRGGRGSPGSVLLGKEQIRRSGESTESIPSLKPVFSRYCKTPGVVCIPRA